MKLSEKYFEKVLKPILGKPGLFILGEIKCYAEIIRKETIQLFWKKNTPEYKLLESELKEIAKENNL